MQRGMAEFGIVTWMIIAGIALWCVAVSMGAIAKRLDDAVRLHNLRASALALHRRARRQALGLDGWDVDVLEEDARADEPEATSEAVELRRAA